MSTNFNFKSQPATSIEQSERLLALGLKKETADMTIHHEFGISTIFGVDYSTYVQLHKEQGCTELFFEKTHPAWSLDRLRELLPKKIQYDGPLCYREYQLVITDDSVFYVSFEHNDWLLGYGQSLWESMLISIEWLINEELFNKEYLV